MSIYYRTALKGKNNPNWKGGTFYRENSNVPTSLRKLVLIRDNYQCQDCGTKDWNKKPSLLHTHHLTPHAKGGITEIENLITLCFICHWIGKHGYTLNPIMQKIATSAGCGTRYLNSNKRDRDN
jgi:hypothetical protein